MNCHAIINDQLVNSFKITVGQKILLRCDKPINFNNPILLYAGNKYPLVILNTNENSIEVTSYLVGKYSNGQLRLLADGINVPVNGISWETTSSIQGQEPFPFKEMIKLKLPVIPILATSMIILATIILSIIIFNKKRKLKREFESIKKLKSVRSPIDELQYKIKNCERNFLLNQNSLIFIKSLQKEFNTYLARKLEIPFHIWDTKKSMLFLKKRKYIYFNKFSKKITLHLNELQALMDQKKGLSEEEAYSLSENLSMFASIIYDFSKGSNK